MAIVRARVLGIAYGVMSALLVAGAVATERPAEDIRQLIKLLVQGGVAVAVFLGALWLLREGVVRFLIFQRALLEPITKRVRPMTDRALDAAADHVDVSAKRAGLRAPVARRAVDLARQAEAEVDAFLDEQERSIADKRRSR